MKTSRSVPPRSGLARVIIADDHELARAGLRSMLAGDRGLELVGEATNGHEAVALCRQLHPDLAVLDVRMPEMDGLAATRSIKQQCPKTSVLIVTTHEHYDYLLAALKAGAAGYMLKDVSRHELLTAVRRVLRGESILNGELATRALQRLASETAPYEGPPPERLTPREREVLHLIAEGKTNREIAAQLSLSVGTVKIHVEHIIGKMGVSDRTQAAVRAVECGLLRM
jgi:DNA-binding NarL/FixJ family response regulator